MNRAYDLAESEERPVTTSWGSARRSRTSGCSRRGAVGGAWEHHGRPSHREAGQGRAPLAADPQCSADKWRVSVMTANGGQRGRHSNRGGPGARIGALALAGLVSLAAPGCEPTRSLDLAGLKAADHAELRTNHDVLKASLDVSTTRRIAEMIAGEGDGWYEPWYGTPVAKVHVRFLVGDRALATVGIGDSFLTAGPAGLLFKEVEAETCAAIRAAAGLGATE